MGQLRDYTIISSSESKKIDLEKLCCQVVMQSTDSISFQGSWAHIYQDILHAINGPATQLYHHIITRIHEKFEIRIDIENPAAVLSGMSPQA